MITLPPVRIEERNVSRFMAGLSQRLSTAHLGEVYPSLACTELHFRWLTYGFSGNNEDMLFADVYRSKRVYGALTRGPQIGTFTMRYRDGALELGFVSNPEHEPLCASVSNVMAEYVNNNVF